MQRCPWAAGDPENTRYHDEEWGRPVIDDDRLYEKLCLEGFQSGLSWLTVLKKRPQFRKQFKNFTMRKVAKMGDADIEKLLLDPGIIRHRGKIASTINNAKRALEVQAEFGTFAAYIWSFEPPRRTGPMRREMILSETDASRALSKDLRKRGFSFVGPTTVHAFMQAMGLVNDHLDECECQGPCETERKRLKVPKVMG